MKRIILFILTVPLLQYASEQPKSEGSLDIPQQQIAKNNQKEKQLYQNIMTLALQTGESVAVSSVISQLKQSIKQLIITFMTEWNKKLSDEEKALIYPILVKVKDGIMLRMQYPDSSNTPQDVRNKMDKINMDVTRAIMPFGMYSPQVLQKTNIDEAQVVQGLQVIAEALDVIINMFKPTGQ